MAKTGEVKWGEWVAQGVAIAVVVTMLLAFFPGWEMVGKLVAEKDAPAWVQAVGSIAAIFAAIGIAAWQRHEEMQRQRLAEVQLKYAAEKKLAETRLSCERFLATASASIEQLHTEMGRSQDKIRVQIIGAMVTEALAMARAIDFSMLDTTSATTALAARSICAQLVELIDSEVKSVAMPSMQYLRGLLPQYLERIQEVESAWEEDRPMHMPTILQK